MTGGEESSSTFAKSQGEAALSLLFLRSLRINGLLSQLPTLSFAAMNSLFSDCPDRRGTGSIKWDLKPSLDPFWVADMDFVSPEPVLGALSQRVNHGVFGYAQAHEGLIEAVVIYLRERHGHAVASEQIVHLGGLVPALSLAARAFGESGDALMTCTPVYPPFLSVANDAGMETIRVPHRLENGQWTFDWEAMEQNVTQRTRLFLLCNPQNPLGRCFTMEEVQQVASFCQRHDLILVSDEIHCDLVLNETETPFFSALRLAESFHEKLIVLQSPSKTYNIAGLGYAYAVIPNAQVRKRFEKAKGHTSPEINALAYYAAEAAYRHGEPWRQELIRYLGKNRDLVEEFVPDHLPKVHLPKIEATYLAWLETSACGMKNPARAAEEQGLFLSDGAYFGYPQAMRLNFATQQDRVLEALEKISEIDGLADM